MQTVFYPVLNNSLFLIYSDLKAKGYYWLVKRKGELIMNILVTIDSNYADVLIKMLSSLSASNPDEFDVYIAHSSLRLTDLSHISKGVESSRIRLHPIKISADLFEGAHFTKRISKETYYRLLLFEYLPPEVDRILYLDPDITVLNSVRLIYNMEFGDMIFAGAGHTRGIVKAFNRLRLNLGAKGDYINAGVLMINVENMRRYVDAQQIFSFISRRGKTLFQADQDVINGLFRDKIISLNPCYYNLDEATYRRSGLDLDWVRQNCVFVHYNGKNKPWKKNYKGELGVFWKQEPEQENKPSMVGAAV